MVGEGLGERGGSEGGGGLRGELNFVNGVFLRASHSALKAKPPGWGLWSAGIRHAQSVPLLKSPSESYLFEQPFLNLFLYQLVGCDLAKCFGNRRHRWLVKWRRFLFFCFLLPRWFLHTLILLSLPLCPHHPFRQRLWLICPSRLLSGPLRLKMFWRVSLGSLSPLALSPLWLRIFW